RRPRSRCQRPPPAPLARAAIATAAPQEYERAACHRCCFAPGWTLRPDRRLPNRSQSPLRHPHPPLPPTPARARWPDTQAGSAPTTSTRKATASPPPVAATTLTINANLHLDCIPCVIEHDRAS